MAASKLSLKLLVDVKSKKILFAEAGKDFIDFLFSILTMPLGSVMRILTKEQMVGSLGKLYESVQNISDAYFQPNQDKNSLLKPKTASTLRGSSPPLLLQNYTSTTAYNYYSCQSPSHRSIYYTDEKGTQCPGCFYAMSTVLNYVEPQSVGVGSDEEDGGYVKGVVTYTVMDDLTVTPMSTISSITLLNGLHIKELGALKEKVVEVGIDEGLALLKASLQSKTVLTDVFLAKLDQ